MMMMMMMMMMMTMTMTTMTTEVVFETLVQCGHLTWLITREDYIKFSRRESSKTLTLFVILSVWKLPKFDIERTKSDKRYFDLYIIILPPVVKKKFMHKIKNCGCTVSLYTVGHNFVL
jgi:hypothetical protein